MLSIIVYFPLFRIARVGEQKGAKETYVTPTITTQFLRNFSITSVTRVSGNKVTSVSECASALVEGHPSTSTTPFGVTTSVVFASPGAK